MGLFPIAYGHGGIPSRARMSSGSSRVKGSSYPFESIFKGTVYRFIFFAAISAFLCEKDIPMQTAFITWVLSNSFT